MTEDERRELAILYEDYRAKHAIHEAYAAKVPRDDKDAQTLAMAIAATRAAVEEAEAALNAAVRRVTDAGG